MNISTYESQIKALEAGGGGGGGGSSDGVFVITIDFDNMTSDKTFSEVKNAVLNKTPILINLGSYMLPDLVAYTDDETEIAIDVSAIWVTPRPTPTGSIQVTSFGLYSDNTLTLMHDRLYNFTVTEENV